MQQFGTFILKLNVIEFSHSGWCVRWLKSLAQPWKSIVWRDVLFITSYMLSLFRVWKLLKRHSADKSTLIVFMFNKKCCSCLLLLLDVHGQPHVLQLDGNSEVVVTVDNRDGQSPNTAITHYYQCCPLSLEDAVVLHILKVQCWQCPLLMISNCLKCWQCFKFMHGMLTIVLFHSWPCPK